MSTSDVNICVCICVKSAYLLNCLFTEAIVAFQDTCTDAYMYVSVEKKHTKRELKQ